MQGIEVRSVHEDATNLFAKLLVAVVGAREAIDALTEATPSILASGHVNDAD